jgi:hypothetical protein
MGSPEEYFDIVAQGVGLWKNGETPNFRKREKEDTKMRKEADAQNKERKNQNKGQLPAPNLILLRKLLLTKSILLKRLLSSLFIFIFSIFIFLMLFLIKCPFQQPVEETQHWSF